MFNAKEMTIYALPLSNEMYKSALKANVFFYFSSLLERSPVPFEVASSFRRVQIHCPVMQLYKVILRWQ